MQEQLLFDKSLQMIELMFRIYGINISKKKRGFTQNCILIFNILWHQTDCICIFLWVIRGIVGNESLTQLTQIAPCSIYGIVFEIKVFFLVTNENKLRILMNNLRDLEIKSKDFVFPERNSLIKSEMRFLNVAVKVLKVLSCLLILVFNLMPLISTAVKYSKSGQMEPELPLPASYPIDASDLSYWPIAFIHQVWSIISCQIVLCAADSLIYICCSHIIMQFKLLQHQLQEFIPHRSGFAVDPFYQPDVRAKFQELIKWHQDIIRSTNILDEINTVSTLIVFLASSLLICLTGFSVVTAADDKTLLIKYMIFLFLSMVQIFFLCFFGDILMSSSTDVANAVFNSKWYQSDVVVRRNALLVQMRAQNPCKLTAAGFADVNLRAYMKIMSTSWSYFALLQTMYGSRS